MNLFEVFPQLADEPTPSLYGRSLRLIALSAILYDGEALYFELGERKLWGRLPNGGFSVGISAAKVQPDPYNTPLQLLAIQLRKRWKCEIEIPPFVGEIYVLDENQHVHTFAAVTVELPNLLILTPPRLGGGDEVPDALVQAVYVRPLRRWRGRTRGVSLLRVQKAALTRFLEPRDWDLQDLETQSWAEFWLTDPLPKVARVRPVLALRGMQHLLKVATLPVHLGSLIIEKEDAL